MLVGTRFFERHSVLGGAVVAGVSGLIAGLIFEILSIMFSIKLNSPLWVRLLLVFVSSGIAGFPMRFSPDPISSEFFKVLRETYYAGLDHTNFKTTGDKIPGFWWATYTDAQSGVFVAIVYYIVIALYECGM